MTTLEKVVLVVRKTRLAELIERFNTHAQAKFYLTQAGLDFDDYQREDDAYHRSLDMVRSSIGDGLKLQQLDRSLVPTYLFAVTRTSCPTNRSSTTVDCSTRFRQAVWC